MEQIIEEFGRLVRKKVGGHVRKVVLFGSHARGTATPDSDYDFLIVADNASREIRDAVVSAAVEILDRYNSLIGAVVCDEQQWEEKKRFPIGLNILSEGIEI